MADLSDTVLFQAGKRLMTEEKGNSSSMPCPVLGELANTTFNSHQEHCPSVVLHVDHTNVQSVTVYKPSLPTAGLPIEICAKVAVEGTEFFIKGSVFHYCCSHLYYFHLFQELLFTL